jgi:hypothetical protein
MDIEPSGRRVGTERSRDGTDQTHFSWEELNAEDGEERKETYALENGGRGLGQRRACGERTWLLG